MVQISIVYFSQFKGSTERLAQAIARGAVSVPETDVAMIRVEEVDDHWARLHASDAIVFGTPTYIGSVAAKFKEFVEKLAGEVWLERMWVNKIAAGFTVSAGRSGDKLSCLQQLVIFAARGARATAAAGSDEGLEAAPPPSDIHTAELHGHHIAHVTRQFAWGRRQHPADYDAFAVQVPPGEGMPKTLGQLLAD